jgi:hypothetical protein
VEDNIPHRESGLTSLSTGKQVLKVTTGTVQHMGSEGAGGRALDSFSKEVLIIEEEIFENPKELLDEVTHELAYEVVRDGIKGVPGLNVDAVMKYANDWLESFITEGDRTWEFLRSIGKR